MVTRNGVYYDLTKSTYKVKLPDTGITFVFSSDLHKVKFQEQYLKHRKEQNIKMIARFRLNINTAVLPDMVLYKKIETRGFLIMTESGESICQENLILGGEKVTLKG